MSVLCGTYRSFFEHQQEAALKDHVLGLPFLHSTSLSKLVDDPQRKVALMLGGGHHQVTWVDAKFYNSLLKKVELYFFFFFFSFLLHTSNPGREREEMEAIISYNYLLKKPKICRKMKKEGQVYSTAEEEADRRMPLLSRHCKQSGQREEEAAGGAGMAGGWLLAEAVCKQAVEIMEENWFDGWHPLDAHWPFVIIQSIILIFYCLFENKL